MIRKITTFLLLLILSEFVSAQQDPMYSQYVFNGLLINPAYAGTRDVLNATALYRNQWVNIKGAPKTGVFSVDCPVHDQKVGLGLTMAVDKIGVTSHSSVSGIYAYKLNFPESSLAFGIEAGVGFYNSNNSEVIYSDNSTVDPAFTTDYHMVLPNFSCGMYYYSTNFYAGLSVKDILGSSIQSRLYPNVANDVTINIVSHYFLTSGYVFEISPNVKFQPSFLLKYVRGAPVSADINGVVSFFDVIYFGLSHKSYASMDILTQVRLNRRLSVGYSHEYSTNELSNFTSGSNEIVLRYQFDLSKNKLLNPRFF